MANNRANRDDCVIHAHMIATSTSFKVAQWANGRPRGVLSVYGGICQKFRGPVGTGYLRGDTVVVNTGYSKDYHYDDRLAFMPPPGYELYLQIGRYKILTWREVDVE